MLGDEGGEESTGPNAGDEGGDDSGEEDGVVSRGWLGLKEGIVNEGEREEWVAQMIVVDGASVQGRLSHT